MARYKDAIRWIVDNDDTEWIHDEEPISSVSAGLVADLFNKSDEQVQKDIAKELKHTQ